MDSTSIGGDGASGTPKTMTKRRILHDAQDGADAIAPANLLAVFVSPPGVGDADFVDRHPHLRQLGGDLGFKAEPVLFDIDCLDHVTAEDLVARLHVGEVQISDHVGHQSEESVADAVPEVQHSMRFTRYKS